MSVRKVKDGRGRWRYQTYVYDSARRRSVYVGSFDREKDAAGAEYEARRRLKMGEPARSKPQREEVSFTELGCRWLASRVNIRRSTRVDYDNAIRRLRPSIGRKDVSEITRKDIDDLVAALAGRYSPSTCRKTMTVFMMIMRMGVAWGYLDVLPTYGQRLALPKVRKRRFEPLSPDEVNRLVDSFPPYWQPAIIVLFTVGTRRAELFGLTLDDLDLKMGTLTIRHQLQKGRLVEPKTDAAIRRVILPRRTLNALRVHVESVPDSELHLLFPTESGCPVDADNWYHRIWKPARDAAGLPNLRIHDARHHLASILLGQGRSVKLVQRMLGHATASLLLDVYTWITPTEEDKAASDLDHWIGEEKFTMYAG